MITKTIVATIQTSKAVTSPSVMVFSSDAPTLFASQELSDVTVTKTVAMAVTKLIVRPLLVRITSSCVRKVHQKERTNVSQKASCATGKTTVKITLMKKLHAQSWPVLC